MQQTWENGNCDLEKESTEEVQEITKEWMRKRWHAFIEQQYCVIQQIHANTSNLSCLTSHFTCSIVACIRKYDSKQEKNGEKSLGVINCY